MCYQNIYCFQFSFGVVRGFPGSKSLCHDIDAVECVSFVRSLVFHPQISVSYIALPGDKEAKNGCQTVEEAQQSTKAM